MYLFQNKPIYFFIILVTNFFKIKYFMKIIKKLHELCSLIELYENKP